jgi:hypothetical protein
MAAGLGFKDFVTGEVLTAADVDGYLMQGIWVFASTAARDAAVTAPAEGNFAFTKDTNGLWYYDGAAWVASGATGDIEGVTAGTGISGGGTSGTVTITNSMATAIDAKGDLIGGTGADTFARLAVGANDTVLTADSTAATGLKWAAVAGGSSFSGCRLTKSANQNITSNTFTTVTWDTETYDVGGYHDNSTNNSRITIPSGKAGYYQINSMFAFAASASGSQRIGRIKKNGSASYYNNAGTAGLTSGGYASFAMADIVYGAVADYFEIDALSSGATLDIIGDGAGDPGITTFSMIYLGA